MWLAQCKKCPKCPFAPRLVAKVRRAGLSHVEAARRWYASLRVLEHLAAHGVLAGTFRYADRVTEPEATLREVAAGVGVAFDPLILEGARNPIMPPDYRHGRFVAEKATEHPSLPPGIETRIRPDLDRLGASLNPLGLTPLSRGPPR